MGKIGRKQNRPPRFPRLPVDLMPGMLRSANAGFCIRLRIPIETFRRTRYLQKKFATPHSLMGDLRMPHLSRHHETIDDREYAAILIDFENIYYYLQNEYADPQELPEIILEMLRSLSTHMQEDLGLHTIVRFAYADFERLQASPLGSMYLMGIEIRNVLGAQHKNAADMRLCIDAMQLLYTRPDIRTFVFVAGDRDYIPVIQHIQTQARTVKAVAFEGNLSGDLLQNIGKDNFINAAELLGKERVERLEKDAAYALEKRRIVEEKRREMQAERDRAIAAELEKIQDGHAEITPEGKLQSAGTLNEGKVPDEKTAQKAQTKKDDTVKFEPVIPIENEFERTALKFMLEEYGSYSEIYLIPFLRKFNDLLPRLADHDRKAILFSLEQYGAIRVKVRRAQPFDYRVIIVNYNHETVRELNPG
jgi:uncharacterized LabA/DUF88 family protein